MAGATDYTRLDGYTKLVVDLEGKAQRAMFKAIFIAFKNTANMVSYYPGATEDWQLKLRCVYAQCDKALEYAFNKKSNGTWARKSIPSEHYVYIRTESAYFEQPPWLTLIAQNLRLPEEGGNPGLRDLRRSMMKKSHIDIGALARTVYEDLTLHDHSWEPTADAETRLVDFVDKLHAHCTPNREPPHQNGLVLQQRLRSLLRCATHRFSHALIRVMEQSSVDFPDVTLRVHNSGGEEEIIAYETLEHRLMAHEDRRVDYMAILAALKNCWGSALHWNQCGTDRARKGFAVTQAEVDTNLASMLSVIAAAELKVSKIAAEVDDEDAGFPASESSWLRQQLIALGWQPPQHSATTAADPSRRTACDAATPSSTKPSSPLANKSRPKQFTKTVWGHLKELKLTMDQLLNLACVEGWAEFAVSNEWQDYMKTDLMN
jgi:hypothetical protein